MRKFKFRLDRILSFRKLLTDQDRGHLAHRVGQLSNAERNASELRNIRISTREKRIEKIGEGTTPPEAKNIHEHILRIEETIVEADAYVEQAKGNVREATEKLVDSRKNEQVLKSLKKRKFDTWERDYYRDEGKTLDDIATVKYSRENKK